MAEKRTFVEPSAPGPTQKLVPHKDGTTHVVPGSAHEAKEGTVINPGVRTVATEGSAPRCPVCRKTGTLKMHMNQPEGKRIYCSSETCSYDQSKANSGLDDDSRAKVLNKTGGVKILRQTGPNN